MYINSSYSIRPTSTSIKYKSIKLRFIYDKLYNYNYKAIYSNSSTLRLPSHQCACSCAHRTGVVGAIFFAPVRSVHFFRTTPHRCDFLSHRCGRCDFFVAPVRSVRFFIAPCGCGHRTGAVRIFILLLLRFVSTLGRRYKLWWSGNDAGFGGGWNFGERGNI